MLGLPSKKFLKVRDLMDIKAKIISIRTSTDMGATVKTNGSFIFSILIATSSAIKIDTIKSITPKWTSYLFSI